MNEKKLLKEVQSEYGKLDFKWLRIHLYVIAGLSLFAMILEIVMFFVLEHIGILSSSAPFYLKKYIFFPTFCNGILTASGFFFVYKTKIPDTVKNYLVSIFFVLMCFIISVVHGLFFSIYSIFVLPIVLTTIYGNFRLTTVTAALSLVLEYVSAFYIVWDPDKTYNSSYFADVIVSLAILFCIYLACIVIIVFGNKKQTIIIKNELERLRLQEELMQDGLTGIYNRTALRGFFNRMVEDAAHKPYHLAMLDIDNFKMVNDTYGHLKGDEMLKAFGKLLKKHCGTAVPFRFGGDEFCILFTGNTKESVLQITEEVQHVFNEYALLQHADFPITLSAGIAAYFPAIMTPHDLLEHADIALYQSKNMNKNEITFYKETVA